MATKTQKERKASGKQAESLNKLNEKLGNGTPISALRNPDFKHGEVSADTITTVNIADILSNSQNPRESASALTDMGYGIFHKLEGSDKSALVPLGLSEKAEDRAEYVKLITKFESGIVALAKNMRQIGTLQPCLVRPIEGGYDLIFGCRRLLAVLFNFCDIWDGKKEDQFQSAIRTMITQSDDERANLTSLSENLHRLNMNPMEQARIYGKMKSSSFTVQEIADLTDVDHQVVRQRLALLKLPTDQQNKVEEGELGVVKALKIVKGKTDDKKGGASGKGATGKGHNGDGKRRKAPSISDLQEMYETCEPDEVFTEQVRKWIAVAVISVTYLTFKQLQKEKSDAEKAAAKVDAAK